MNWQPAVYCFSLATLMATVVAGAFTPFCRRRQPAPDRSGSARRARESASAEKKDRISSAMSHWITVRTDADLAHVPPPPPPPLPPPVEVEAPLAVSVPCAIQMAPAPHAVEAQAPHEDDPRAVAEPNPFLGADFHGAPSFYEILQISPRADLETIHRVYRIMAARFHPDNPVSGDHEMFLKLCEAYEVLSRPERRALYDYALFDRETEAIPIFGDRIFVDGLDGELNRRFGVLALLYQRRRTNQGNLGISVLELESRMSLPREHLEFTLWYLRCKGYVHVLEENSDYAVTALGVDYVEANSAKNPILRELLTAGCPTSRPAPRAPADRRSRLRVARREGRGGAFVVAG